MKKDFATKLVFTVDVEGKKGVCELDEQLHLVKKGVDCGLNKILDIADTNKIKVTFFVDVYEIKKQFGIRPVQRLTRYIYDRGHDIQLHTHPGPFFDYKRNKMFQFSHAEQEEIVRTGAKLIHEWTGYYPEAHRAGAYAANKDTISVLKQTGFKLDSSYFLGHRNCKLKDDFPYYNELYQMEEILQLPVTIYEFHERPCVLRQFLKPLVSLKKIDIDACSLFELREAISNAVKMQYGTVTIFMHSFSLVRTNDTPDVDDIVKLEKLMRWVRENEFKTMTTRELFTNATSVLQQPAHKTLPQVRQHINLITYLLKRLKRRI